jgi:hypothetical protein
VLADAAQQIGYFALTSLRSREDFAQLDDNRASCRQG